MGASDRDVDDVGLEARVRDLSAVVEHLGLGHFALGAVDIGAVTAIAYVVEQPAVVSRLVLVSPWASGDRYLQLPALRAAYSAQANGEREWRLFANILKGIEAPLQDGGPLIGELKGALTFRPVQGSRTGRVSDHLGVVGSAEPLHGLDERGVQIANREVGEPSHESSAAELIRAEIRPTRLAIESAERPVE
jgi:pimeloyl-ACP methyl ester carboxylesterase